MKDIGTRPLHRLLPLLLALSGLVPAHAQDVLYWTGGAGSWHDARMWSTTPQGPGGAGVPSDRTAVHIGGDPVIHVRVDRSARCGDLLVEAPAGTVLVEGAPGARIDIGGDWRMAGNVDFVMPGGAWLQARAGKAVLDLHAVPVEADVVLATDAAWAQRSALVLDGGHALRIERGRLDMDGGVLRAGLLHVGARARGIGAEGAILLLDAITGSALSGLPWTPSTMLLVNGEPRRWDGAAVAQEEILRAAVNCGTGTGQTPFQVNATVTSNYNGFGITCTGVCDGAVNVTVAGGVGPFAIQWQGGPSGTGTSLPWTNTCAGNKLVIVTDLGQNVGCFATALVTPPPPLGVIFFGLNPPACAAVCNGTAITFPGGGAGTGYQYDWNNGTETTPNPTQLCAGLNTLELVDGNGCVFDTTFTITLLPLDAQLQNTAPSCAGTCDGTAGVTVTGGTPAYSYNWEPGSPAGDGTAQVTGLCAGSYTVLVSDANGCDTLITFDLLAPDPILPGLSVTPATCADICDGQAFVAPTGATGPFTYQWSPAPGSGQGTASAGGLCPGSGTVLITDLDTGCDTLVAFTITSPPSLDAVVTPQDATCPGVCNGSASAAVAGGTPAYSYTWTPAPGGGQGTPDVTGLCAGAYTLLVVDAAGCDTLIPFTIAEPPAFDLVLDTLPVSCAGACDGEASLQVTGGTPGYTVLWSNGQNGNTISALCGGSYSVTVADAAGCDTTVTFIVNEPLPLDVVPSQTDVSCGGLCDGTASVAVTGGTPGYTYVWTPAPGGGQGTADATGLCAGAYSVLVTDAGGCDTTVTITVLDAVPLQFALTPQDASCPGVCDGGAAVVITGGAAPYAYVWTPAPGSGQGSDLVTGLCAGGYQLTVTDALGCDSTVAFTIAEPAPVIPNQVAVPPTCASACDGSITLSPTGGDGVYSYSWNPVPPNGQGQSEGTGLCAGTWSVTVSSGGCDTTLTLLLEAPPALDVLVAPLDATCSDACDGSAAAQVGGGTAPYTYLWSPAPGGGQGTPNATGLCAGSYTLVVADAAGCDTTVTFLIAEPAALDVPVATTPSGCGGACDGTASAAVLGGTAPYTYTWSPAPGGGQGAPDATGLCPGVYDLLVMDAAGCDTTVSITITTPGGITAQPQVTPVSCADVCDGAIDLTVSGGVPPYAFTWSPAPQVGAGTASVSALCPGDWSVVISDQAGCDTLLVINVPAPPSLDVVLSFNNESCNGPCDGDASVAVSGGQPGYQYLWSPPPGAGQGTPAATALCAGAYTVTVTDAGGCDSTLAFLVLPQQPIDVGLLVGNVVCPASCDGTATVSPTGGVGAFSFFWQPEPAAGQGTSSVTGLCAEQYAVTVTDAAGCDTTVVFEVSGPSSWGLALDVLDESCAGPCTGGASVLASGSNGGPYTFLWQPEPGAGQGTDAVTGLCAGVAYTVTITDALGCDTTVAFLVEPYAPIEPDATSTPVSCSDACDGTATVSPAGGLPPYSYFWDPAPGAGQGTAAATGLCAGNYAVTITDLNGCDTTVQVVVAPPLPLDLGAVVSPVNCAGQCNGSIVLAPSGGAPGYTFDWTPDPPNGDGTESALGLCPGTYTVLVLDANGCDTAATFTLLEPLALSASASTTESQCQQCIGTAAAIPAGGSAPYTYQWTGQGGVIIGTDSLLTGLCAGFYTLLVSDANNCFSSQPVVIADSDGELLATADGQTACAGGCDGAVSVQYVCADPPCTVLWTDAQGIDLGQPTDNAANLCAGLYLVQVTNASGCVSVDSATVTSPLPLDPDLSTTPETCAGACDGTATVAPVGGLPPFTYDWTPDPQGGDGGPQATGLCAGTYDLLITDQAGCSTLVSVLITPAAPIDAGAVITPPTCATDCNGAIVLAPTGGAPGYSYQWQPVPPNGQGSAEALDLCPGVWSVTIADASGCDSTFVFTIASPSALSGTLLSTPSQCQVCIGAAELTPFGGTAPYAVEWTDGNGQVVGSAPAVTGLCAGLYTAVLTDANGCTLNLVTPITDTDGEVLTVLDGNTSCTGNCDGELEVQFTCSAPPCTVTWADAQGDTLAQGSNVLSGLCVGSYLVLVGNASGCLTIDTVTVSAAPVFQTALSTTPETCPGACDGTATVGVAGGAGPFSYDWSPDPVAGDGTPQATGLCAGSYSVVLTDQGTGCDTLVNVLIVAPSPIDAQVVVTDAGCPGQCDGSIVAAPLGGTAPYSFAWTPVPANGDGTNAALGLCAGTYDLLITDAVGCSAAFSFTVAEPAPLVLTTTATPSECGQCVGTASVQVSGGAPPFTYTWSLAGTVVSSDSAPVNLCAGLYLLTVEDANGCTTTAAVPVTDSNGEVLTITDGVTSCAGVCDGAVAVDFVCSDPPCTVVWSDINGVPLAANTNALDSLCAGEYLVTLTNASGCITIDTARVVAPDPVTPLLSTTPVSCSGACDGAATVGITGGTAPYAIDWGPDPIAGDGTPQVTQLCAGSYDLLITDAFGCSTSAAVLITTPAPITVTAALGAITCNGTCDGNIVLAVAGGTPGYAFDWTPDPPNGDGTNAAFALCAGVYSVQVTDANGCDTTLVLTLTEPAALQVQVSTLDNVCFGDCAGTASALTSGGTAPYAFTWTDAGGTVIATDTAQVGGLCAGDLTLVVTDALGCTLAEVVTIGQGSPIEAAIVVTDATCGGPCDGTAALSPSGGSGPYAFSWQPEPGGGQGTPVATGLCPGAWSVTITDALGCDTTVQFLVAPYVPIAPGEVVNDVGCNGACDGSIQLAPSGGAGTYTFTWSPVPPNGQGGPSATGLCAGPWSVTITDAIGCDTTLSFTVQEPPALVLAVDSITPASCNTAQDGAIAITVGGGVGGFTVLWTGPGGYTSTQQDIAQLAPGTYTVVLTDANGCQLTQEAEVNPLITVTADAGPDQQVCLGADVVLDGSASTGGTQWVWTDAQGVIAGSQPVIALPDLTAGTYTYTFTVSDGPCTATDQVTIVVLAVPLADAGPDRTIFQGDGTVIGGDPAGPGGATFSWQPDSLVNDPFIPNPLATPPATTWFVLTVTSSEGCVSADSVLVTVVPEVVIPSGFTPNGDGWNDVWQIDLIDRFVECEVEVYSRWGELLFRSVGYKDPWDGRYNGAPVPVGTYYYAIRLNHPDFPEPYVGPLTVIR